MDFLNKTIGRVLAISLFCVPFLSASQALAAENLIKNSSFELGLSQAVSPAEFYLVDGGSYHGNKHAKFKVRRVYLNSLQLSLPGSYTFSAYIRSNPAGARVRLGFYDNQWTELPRGSTVTISDKWVRYHVTVSLPSYTDSDGRKNVYRPTIFVADTNMEVHIDAIQLESGPLTPYLPRKEIEIGGCTSKYANVFTGDESLNFVVGISNYTDSSKSIKLDIKTNDIFERTVLSQTLTKSISPNQVVLVPLTIPTSQKGHFRTTLDAFEGNAHLKKHVMDIARIKSIKDTSAYHPNSSLGIDPRETECNYDTYIEAQRWNLLVESGVHWIRSFILWNYVESQRGTYDWSYYDKLFSLAKQFKLNIIACFIRKKPSWASGETLNQKAYANFCMAAIKRYGNIAVWELGNETYWHYPTNANPPSSEEQAIFDAYISFHKSLYRKIKSSFPTKKILLNAYSLFQNKENLRFLKDSAARGLLDFCGGISGHNYPGYFPGKELDRYDTLYRLVSSILKSCNKPGLDLWQTEAGFSSDDLIDTDNNLYSEYAQHMQPNAFGYGPEIDVATTFVKAHIIQMSHGVKVDCSFRMGSTGPYPSLFTMFKDHWLSPKMIYPASNAMADIIDEKQFVERINISDKIVMPVFKGTANYIIPYWSVDSVSGSLSVSNLSTFSVKDMMGNNITANSQLPLSSYPNYLFVKLGELDKFKSGLTIAAERPATKLTEAGIKAPSNLRVVVP